MKTLTILAPLLFSLSALAFVDEKIQFQTHDGIQLNAYVSRPDQAGSYPALIMQMGSGEGSTDNATRSYNPFAALARTLADQGFVVLRFDKRGTGYNSTNGSFADGLFSDYVSDFKSAVRTVQARADVKRSDIYFFGHSLGGPVITVAAKDFPEVKGIILSATPGRSFLELNVEQTLYILKWGNNLSEDQLQSKVEKQRRSSSLIGDSTAFCAEFPEDCTTKNGKTYFWAQSAEFWKEIAALDPLASLKDTTCPVLAIHGTSDWVISSDNDGGAIRNAMSGRPNFTGITMDKLDHFLLKMESKEEDVKFFMGANPGFQMEIHPEYIPAITAMLKQWSKN